jgi:hypothetical protein
MKLLTTRRRTVLATAVAVVLGIAGCILRVEPDGTPATPAPLTIELVNETFYAIDANFFISETAADEEGLFIQQNIYTDYSTRVSRTFGPNETANFELPCERIQSMGVQEPVFSAQVGIGGGRSADVIFLLRDRDYSCGARLRFTYFTEGEQFRVSVQPF